MLKRNPDKYCFLLPVIFLVCFLQTICFASGKELPYAVRNIPAQLLKDADAVVRIYRQSFKVKNSSSAVYTVKKAVTIFTREEREQGEINLQYDRMIDIDELEGRIYDSDGRLVKELESDDIKDNVAIAGYTLYGDSRAKSAGLYYDVYPYTVEYEYEISYDGYISWPAWLTYPSDDAVEMNSFEVMISDDQPLRYWCNRDSLKPALSTDGSYRVYRWEAGNLPKLSRDAIGDDTEDVSGIVMIAPTEFTVEGYKGRMDSWKEFGRWAYSLALGRDKLPAGAATDVDRMTAGIADTVSMIKKLYEYLQNRTRYVNISLGIGGWQPFDAKYVHERGYGDCKALSNYMVALLKYAGITAYPVLINSGYDRLPIVPEFPSNQFTHVIVCVPLQKDSIWLECTSQTIPFGVLGPTTENRQALMVTPEGGMLVNVPATSCYENTLVRSSSIKINNDGSAAVSTSTVFRGDQQVSVRMAIYRASPDECRNWVQSSVDIPDGRLKNFSLTGIEDKNPVIRLDAEFISPRFASVSGTRVFFQPNAMDRYNSVPPHVSERLSPVRFRYPYTNVDTVSYTIPENYIPESVPAEISRKEPFGEFLSRYSYDGNRTITFIRSLSMKNYSIPAADYGIFREFMQEIVKTDRSQIVLIRKNK